MGEILVIRFGALGDLCVLGWALSRLVHSQAPGSCRVTLVTKAAFAPLMSQVHGIDQVITLKGSSLADTAALAAQLRRQPWDVVIDAHNTLRSHLLLALLGRRCNARLAKDTAARLSFMTFGRQDQRLGQTMRDRFNDLTAAVCPTELTPQHTPPLAHLAPSAGSSDPVVAFAPGAQWDTKRWPHENFARLLQSYCQQTKQPVQVYLGPREARWYPGSALAQVVKATAGAEIIQVPDLIAVAKNLAANSVLVTNDSGLLHIAEAVGTRVLAFFGPTVREFGYFPLLAGSQVLESPASCRPCSRNGKRPCHQKDLRCLTAITPDQALTTLLSMLQAEPQL